MLLLCYIYDKLLIIDTILIILSIAYNKKCLKAIADFIFHRCDIVFNQFYKLAYRLILLINYVIENILN